MVREQAHPAEELVREGRHGRDPSTCQNCVEMTIEGHVDEVIGQLGSQCSLRGSGGPHVFGELGTRYFLKDALGIARGLHEYFRHSDIVYMANYAQTVNVIGCIKASKTHAPMAATGQVLKLYRNHFGQIPVDVTGQFDMLDVSAALSANRQKVTVSIVNPTYQKYEVSLNLKDGGFSSSFKSWQITGPDEGAFNEPGAPQQVKIEEKHLDTDLSQIRIPPLSVILYELSLE